ncbi:MAG: threonylcarbamoyl-AMP synthase [Tenericutes bacterium HGW-Tenericutes-1]|jgi:L-threonylcarbamoyladenylate synthase|nr:MAG: threonylcarbamoyl-AMP synthase [Tenericutes bacterium HGW-Tenericutes-1]
MVISLSQLLNQNLKGKVIIFETDTVYGIGCLYDDIEMVKRIYGIKRREPQKPMALLCSSVEQVRSLVLNYEIGEPYALKYWPGALTLIFNKNHQINDLITANQNTVGVRIPNSETAKAILNHFGPMVVTSLNISSEPPILKFYDTLKFEHEVDYIVQGNDLLGVASTVYDPMNHKTLRQGEVIIE